MSLFWPAGVPPAPWRVPAMMNKLAISAFDRPRPTKVSTSRSLL
jgi:hypothetical protein